jgi:hypothetical protein
MGKFMRVHRHRKTQLTPPKIGNADFTPLILFHALSRRTTQGPTFGTYNIFAFGGIHAVGLILPVYDLLHPGNGVKSRARKLR